MCSPSRSLQVSGQQCSIWGDWSTEGNSLLLFPEGERTQHSGLLPFQKGLGVMVQELGIPVVPVAIIGLEKIMPRGANWPKKGEVRVVFGQPIDFSGKSADEIVELSEEAVRCLLGNCRTSIS